MFGCRECEEWRLVVDAVSRLLLWSGGSHYGEGRALRLFVLCIGELGGKLEEGGGVSKRSAVVS